MQKTLPRGWANLPLGKLIFPRKERYKTDITKIEVLSVTNDQGFIRSEDYFKKQVFSKDIKGYKIVRKGDFAYNPSRINVGSIALLTDINIGVVSPIYEVFTPSEKILGKYLLLIFKSSLGLSLINYYSEGTVRHSLKYQGLSKIPIPLPPLPTQHKIVEILEEADNLRKLRKQTDEKMKDLIPSLFVQMFGDPDINPKGWEVKKLGDICIDMKNGFGKNKEFYGSGVKVANINDLYDSFRFVPIHFSYINASEKEIEQYKLNLGDILFVRSSVKKEGVAVCSAYDSKELCLFGSFMIKLTPNNKIIHPYFLSCCLRTEQMRTLLINASNTVAITNISQPSLKKIAVPLPPLPLQQEFAKLVEDIEAEKARQSESRKNLDELFQSLMQRAFTGELVA